MEILKDIEIVDLSLFLKKHNILIISDIHIGYEEALNKQGVLIPRFQFRDIIRRFQTIVDSKIFNKIIINGDLKHEFGTISKQEWNDTLRFLDLCSKHTSSILLIKGNHDTILGPVAEKKNIKLKNYEIIGDILIMHGDKLPSFHIENIKTVIIGHEHPAISIKEGVQVETYKCFLKGKYRKKNLIVMPSFNLVVEGTDVSKERLISPFLAQDISNFEVFIESKGIFYFGEIKNLKELEK